MCVTFLMLINNNWCQYSQWIQSKTFMKLPWCIPVSHFETTHGLAACKANKMIVMLASTLIHYSWKGVGHLCCIDSLITINYDCAAIWQLNCYLSLGGGTYLTLVLIVNHLFWPSPFPVCAKIIISSKPWVIWCSALPCFTVQCIWLC